MFNINKYTKLYYRIIKNAQSRNIEGYTENHHIIPKSLGGSEAKDNLIKLSAREHFICHWLLIKMVSGDKRAKMIFAFHMMRLYNKNHNNRYVTKMTARVYEKYKIEHAVNISKNNKGRIAYNKGKKLDGIELEKQRERTRNRRKLTPEENATRIAKIVATTTGRKQSQETKDKIRVALTGKAKGPMNENEKLKRSISLKGRKKSDTAILKRKKTLLQLSIDGKHHSQEVLCCPHCGKTAKKIIYSRWHGDKCKLKGLDS
jgi:hypothetical protein